MTRTRKIDWLAGAALSLMAAGCLTGKSADNASAPAHVKMTLRFES